MRVNEIRVPSLAEEAAEFLNTATILRRFDGHVRVFPPLQRLYLMRAAYWIRKSVSFDVVGDAQSFSSGPLDKVVNPTFEVMYESYRRLLVAYRFSDQVTLDSALQEMGVPELCPSLNNQLERMEQLVEHREPFARLILHLELALFALELGIEGTAKFHAQQAWMLNPIGWERYTVCTLQGFFEACVGNVVSALHWLEESISACFSDETVLIECGVLPPNLRLAQKLFSIGQQIPVIDYLLACKDVWRSKSMPFAEWVQEIETGEEPNFEASEVVLELSRPFHRLDLLSKRLCAPSTARPGGDQPYIKKSRQEVLIARERRLAEVERTLNKIKQDEDF